MTPIRLQAAWRLLPSCAVAFALAAAPTALAQDAPALGWQPVADLASPVAGAANLPAITIDEADGTTYAAWVRASTSGGPSLVQVASKPRHGTWSTPATVSRDVTGQTGSRVTSAAPKIVAADGAVAVAWAQTGPASTSSSTRDAWAATKRPGGGWNAPQQLSDGGASAAPADGVTATVAADGTATVAWTALDGAEIVTRDSRPDGTFAPQRLVAGGSAALVTGYVDIVTATGGEQTIVWQDEGTNPNDVSAVIRVARRAGAGKPWSAYREISDPQRYALFPDAEVAPNGRVDVVWQSRIVEVSTTAQNEIYTASLPTDPDEWTAPRLLSGPGGVANGRGNDKQAALAIDVTGTATVAWVRSDGANADNKPDVVKVRTRPQGGTWDAAVDAWTGRRNPTLRAVAIAPGRAGEATIAVSGYKEASGSATGPRSLRVVRRDTATGAWSAERELLPAGTGSSSATSWLAAIAADALGNVEVAWHVPDATGEVGVKSASFLAPLPPKPAEPSTPAPAQAVSAAPAPPAAPAPRQGTAPSTARTAVASTFASRQRRDVVLGRGVRVTLVGTPGERVSIVARQNGRAVSRTLRASIGRDGRLGRRVLLTVAGKRSVRRSGRGVQLVITSGGQRLTRTVSLR